MFVDDSRRFSALPQMADESQVSHASTRVASAIMCLVVSPTDAKSIAEWARVAASSSTTLRTWCNSARTKPKNALDFARLLRICNQPTEADWQPLERLNIVDPRTLCALVRRSGCPSLIKARLTPLEFLSTQRLITNKALIAAIAQSLKARNPRAENQILD
jgi:hypothetical protein